MPQRYEDLRQRRPDIVFLSDGERVLFEDEWYGVVDPSHFWIQWRFRAWRAQMRDLGVRLDAAWRVLDVGGGRGLLRQQIEAVSQWSVDLADVNLAGLEHSIAGRGEVLCYNVLERRPARLGAYDAAILFDVLEHIRDARTYLAATLAHLRPGGLLFLNVPAVPALYSAYDRVQGHLRRYDRPSLTAEFAGVSARVLDIRYWGLSLLPLLVARRTAMRRVPSDEARRREMTRRGMTPPAAWVDSLLRALMRAETALLPRVLFGTSLLCACEKT